MEGGRVRIMIKSWIFPQMLSDLFLERNPDSALIIRKWYSQEQDPRIDEALKLLTILSRSMAPVNGILALNFVGLVINHVISSDPSSKAAIAPRLNVLRSELEESCSTGMLFEMAILSCILNEPNGLRLRDLSSWKPSGGTGTRPPFQESALIDLKSRGGDPVGTVFAGLGKMNNDNK